MNTVNPLIPTRQSLLGRLKDWNDQESWKAFFDTYWRLIYNAAIKAGLNDAEAQDVVQETVVSVLKSIPNFQYDAQKGSFKNWLFRLTSWRIGDQFRKRRGGIDLHQREPDTSTATAILERVADPVSLKLERTWDEDWERNLVAAAIERVKSKVDPKHYQIFDLCVVKEWPVSRIAQTLNVSPATVHLAKHRINRRIKKEIARLQTKPI
jgi:RNA polymerase sigma-70 factor (ECF subfamily)